MQFLVKVQAIHIAIGWKGNAYACPVALAIMDATEFKTCCAGYDILWLSRDENDMNCPYRVPPPPAVREFIHSFDRGDAVQPFEFTIDIDN